MANKVILSANSLWFLYNFYGGLIKEFQKIGFDVIVTGKSDHTISLLKEMGVLVIEIPFDSKSGNPLRNLNILFNYFKIIRIYRPICVLNFTIKANIYGAIAANFFSIPCINTQPGLGTVFMYKNVKSQVAKYLFKLTQSHPLKVFVLNYDDYYILLNNKLVPEEKISVVPGSGIDLEKFSPSIHNHNENKEMRLLYFGRILKEKGIYELIEAIREIKNEGIDYICKFVGFIDTDNVSAISINEIRQWEEEELIEYEEAVIDIRPFIVECDIVLLPSYREGLPQSLMEASAMEKIIVATNIQGCKDVVIDEYNGFLCEPKNWRSLYNTIKKVIILSLEQRIEMGKNGRKYISERFEKSIVYKNYLDLVNNINKTPLKNK